MGIMLLSIFLSCSFIDLAKVIEVSAADASKQDKNNGSFNINCEGRVFELLAHDETEMNK